MHRQWSLSVSDVRAVCTDILRRKTENAPTELHIIMHAVLVATELFIYSLIHKTLHRCLLHYCASHNLVCAGGIRSLWFLASIYTACEVRLLFVVAVRQYVPRMLRQQLHLFHAFNGPAMQHCENL